MLVDSGAYYGPALTDFGRRSPLAPLSAHQSVVTSAVYQRNTPYMYGSTSSYVPTYQSSYQSFAPSYHYAPAYQTVVPRQLVYPSYGPVPPLTSVAEHILAEDQSTPISEAQGSHTSTTSQRVSMVPTPDGFERQPSSQKSHTSVPLRSSVDEVPVDEIPSTHAGTSNAPPIQYVQPREAHTIISGPVHVPMMSGHSIIGTHLRPSESLSKIAQRSHRPLAYSPGGQHIVTPPTLTAYGSPLAAAPKYRYDPPKFPTPPPSVHTPTIGASEKHFSGQLALVKETRKARASGCC